MLRAETRAVASGVRQAPAMHYVVLRAPRPATGPVTSLSASTTISTSSLRPASVTTTPAHLQLRAPSPLPQRVVPHDLWRYCRVCACAYDLMVPIYDDTGVDMQLEEKINNYLPITVSPEDVLPLQMCQGCIEKLNVTHELIVSCLDADAKFNQFLEEEDTPEIKCEVLSPQPLESEETQKEEEEEEDEEEEETAMEVKTEDTPKVKKKVVVLKLVHSNSSQLPPSVRIAKALEYLKAKKKVEDTTAGRSLNHSTCRSPAVTQRSDNKQGQGVQVAGIAEFCVVTSRKDGSGEIATGSPKFESKITEALGTVDNGTKQRIVEAVQNIVSNRGESQGTCADCCQEFASTTELAEHSCPRRPGKAKGNEFQCKECNKKFKEAYKLTIHKQIHRKDAVFVCHECGQTFTRRDSLSIHQMSHRGQKPHLCKRCGQRFLHRGSLEVHLSKDHSQTRPWVCATCGKAFATKNNWRQHVRAHREAGSVGAGTGARANIVIQELAKCEICGATFRNRSLLREHAKSHRTEAFRCPQCPKAFPTQERLRQHEPIHLGVRPYQCGICAIGFIRKGNLTKHYKTHQAEAIACRVCKATFPSVAGLQNHRKSHSADEWERAREGDTAVGAVGSASAAAAEAAALALATPAQPPDSFQCAVCSKFLSSKLSLALHTRVHTGEKPYACEVCGKRFTQKPALTYHLRLHTGERPHACRFCGKGFNSKVGKESHERIHTGERPYKCGQCGVGFRCSANLRQHTWIHTDNRPFACEVCKKLFRRREALQVHMRIHTGERPYSCPECLRSFTQKGDMLKHARSHAKKSMRTSSMACLYCGELFTRKMHYKIHMEQCSLSKGEFPLAAGELVTLKDGEALRTVAVTADDSVVPKFSEITIVTNDIQEYEVEYQS